MTTSLLNGIKAISDEVGILTHTVRLPRMGTDPHLINFGIWPCDTLPLNGEKFEGRSGACSSSWEGAMIATIGETLERYAPVFYDSSAAIRSSHRELKESAPHPDDFALFHEEQHKYYREKGYNLDPFTEDTVLDWFPCTDLTTGKEAWIPGQFVYMPYAKDGRFVTAGNSTGLAAHTNYYEAILTALYECLERDSFVITWMNKLVPPKVRIDAEIQSFLDARFPPHYDWHFFDMTYDLGVPTIFGICTGVTEFGKFIAVGSAARDTLGEALRKVIHEIGQTTPYFRWLLGERPDWLPGDDFNELMSFSDHSVFYLKRPELWHVFDPWLTAEETLDIDFAETTSGTPKERIRSLLGIFKKKGYPVFLKDTTTPDIRQLGFYSLKILIPQLIQMAGGYPFYFSGGDRLYDVPEIMGYERKGYADLNKYPHPFP